MIVPMKKVSLIVLSEKKEDTLKKLRRLGLMEIQITETSNSRVQELHDQIGELERCLFGLDSKAVGNAPGRSLTPEEALAISRMGPRKGSPLTPTKSRRQCMTNSEKKSQPFASNGARPPSSAWSFGPAPMGRKRLWPD